MATSIFIQVRSYDPAQLATDLEHIYDHHRGEMGVILNEIGDSQLSFNTSTIQPYLPGGRKAAFAHVYVGSHYVRWQGTGSGYREGMLNEAHRWNNLREQRNLWDRWLNVYGTPDGFYIDYEGVLNLFDEWHIRSAYTAYLLQSCRDAHSRGSGIPVVWSPAIWSGIELTDAEESGFARAITDVKRHADPGITHLYLQDMMGRGRSDVTKEDVKQWYRELVQAHQSGRLFTDYGISAELFTKTVDGQLMAENALVINQRYDWYAANGVPVKSMWEMRWWIDAHTHAPSPESPKAKVAQILDQAKIDVLDEL